MGDIYSHPHAPRASNLAQLQRIYLDQGIDLIPWCVPKGLLPEPEASVAIKVLDVTKALILDVEPYQWFWTGPFSNLHPYMQAIRRAHPDAWIGLSFDPRYGQYGPHYVNKYADIHFEEWLPYVDALLPQDYWETFGVDAHWEIEHTNAKLEQYNKEIIHVIPGHADPVDFANAVRVILARDNRFSIWRRGTFAQANADIVASIDEPGTPIVPCAGLQKEVDRLKALVAIANLRLEKQAKVLENYLAEVKAAEALAAKALVYQATLVGTAGQLEKIAKDLRASAK